MRGGSTLRRRSPRVLTVNGYCWGVATLDLAQPLSVEHIYEVDKRPRRRAVSGPTFDLMV